MAIHHFTELEIIWINSNYRDLQDFMFRHGLHPLRAEDRTEAERIVGAVTADGMSTRTGNVSHALKAESNSHISRAEPPLTERETAWLKKHYGSEWEFLRAYGYKTYEAEAQDEGRRLLRQFIAEEEEKEGEEEEGMTGRSPKRARHGPFTGLAMTTGLAFTGFSP